MAAPPPEAEVDWTDPHVCKPLQMKHEECFFKWYQDDFVKGKATELPCEDIFTEYQACVRKRLEVRSVCLF
jgi:Uncharacterised protein family (UPF0203)